MSDRFDELLKQIAHSTDASDQSGQWPADDFQGLADAGAMRWAVPCSFGGDDLSPLELHLKYETLAAASVATALLLSQRDSAVGLIASADNVHFASEALPRLARGEVFTTVGIAQLTTSRQRGAPALRATETADGYRIDGMIPWASGAAQSEFVISGAALPDGRQILFALPADLPGMTIDPPMPLVALRSTWTSSITCDAAILPCRFVLRGPVEQALSARRGHLALGQTFVALGLIRNALDLIAGHDSDRARAAHARLDAQRIALRNEILALCQAGRESDAAAAAPGIRGRCNDLALRATHAAITLYKGTALLVGHPAQRLAREAMFLLVWSCPNPVIDCTLDLLTAPAAVE